jgi:hypothetical protein
MKKYPETHKKPPKKNTIVMRYMCCIAWATNFFQTGSSITALTLGSSVTAILLKKSI